MAFFSTMFFFAAPFALFCSGGGNGLALCSIFIILGFVCRWLGGGNIGKPKLKVSPNEFWETNYGISLAKGSKDEDARAWATTMCRINSCRIPTDEEQEEIAQKRGVVTEAMKREKTDPIDRLQFGKYYLFEKEIQKCAQKKMGKPWEEYSKLFDLEDAMGECLHLIRYTGFNDSIGTFSLRLEKKFGEKDADVVWNTLLSEEERTEAERWVKECIERIKEEEEFKKNGGYLFRGTDKYMEKYGFKIKGV